MSLDAIPGLEGLIGGAVVGLAVAAFRWLGHRAVKTEDESRKSQGERIGKLETAVGVLQNQITRIDVMLDHSDRRHDEVIGSLHGIEAKLNAMAERLAVATGRTTSSTAQMPAVAPPRPRMPSGSFK